MVIRERYHRLDTLLDTKTIPIAVGFELRSELRNRPLCIRFHDLALRTYSSCCVPPNLCLLNCPRNSIARGGHKPRGRQWEQFLPIQKRLRAALACGARRWHAIGAWLEDPAIVEIMLNPDGRLWIDRLAGGLSDTGKRLSAEDGERILRVVAHRVGAEVRSGSPRISAELPTGERFEGLPPPIVKAATLPFASLQSRSLRLETTPAPAS